MRRASQTIKDAMQLVVHLGERHLWVDAVCFIQNVYEDRDAQIWSIDIVYGASVLNVVATGDGDAQAGLPQASKSAADPVQHIETVSPRPAINTTAVQARDCNNEMELLRLDLLGSSTLLSPAVLHPESVS